MTSGIAVSRSVSESGKSVSWQRATVKLPQEQVLPSRRTKGGCATSDRISVTSEPEIETTARIRTEIRTGVYETLEKLDKAVSRMLCDEFEPFVEFYY